MQIRHLISLLGFITGFCIYDFVSYDMIQERSIYATFMIFIYWLVNYIGDKIKK